MRHTQGQSLAAGVRRPRRGGDQLVRSPRIARATALPTPAISTMPMVIGSPRWRAGTGCERSTTGGADEGGIEDGAALSVGTALVGSGAIDGFTALWTGARDGCSLGRPPGGIATTGPAVLDADARGDREAEARGDPEADRDALREGVRDGVRVGVRVGVRDGDGEPVDTTQAVTVLGGGGEAGARTSPFACSEASSNPGPTSPV